uniref:Uncharacterized protein n=1 Tax=Arion vulgaris TaxID=1028688 RepID=A0A0B7B523_9EUPU
MKSEALWSYRMLRRLEEVNHGQVYNMKMKKKRKVKKKISTSSDRNELQNICISCGALFI